MDLNLLEKGGDGLSLIGEDQIGLNFCEWHQDKGTFVESRMGNF